MRAKQVVRFQYNHLPLTAVIERYSRSEFFVEGLYADVRRIVPATIGDGTSTDGRLIDLQHSFASVRPDVERAIREVIA